MNKFKNLLHDLLVIEAPSGEESKVVDHVKPMLEKLCDKVFLDSYGNLLADLKVGTGEGATVILSAHMDTVNGLAKGRKVLYDKKTTTFRSSKGILGADDRAGMAIILTVLENIGKTGFNGNIKVAFSREEEMGCIGANQIPVNWYEGSDLAIVVDRRGNRDIVTGCFSPWNFCSKPVGEFFEEAAAMQGMTWESVGGGISDATTFSDMGINSVNLSAGYFNEHTDKEVVNITYSMETVKLIVQALAIINDLKHKFEPVPVAEKKSYGFGSYKSTLLFQRDGFYQYVQLSNYPNSVEIYTEGDRDFNSVDISHADFERMIDAYCQSTGYAVGDRGTLDMLEEVLDRDEYKEMVEADLDKRHFPI